MTKFVEAAKEAYSNKKKIDKTTTIDLIGDENLVEDIKKLLSKFDGATKDSFSEDEKSIINRYICRVDKIIKQGPMCRVISQNEIKKYIDLEIDLKGFFTRKADFDALLYEKKDCVSALYNGLKLDYPKSIFTPDDDFYGVITVELPQFSIRVPTKISNLDSIKSRYIYINNGWPYTGIGFIANEFLTPEFYISIDQNGKKSEAFPIQEFGATLYLAKKNENKPTCLAIYADESDEYFEVIPQQREFARKKGWIED